MLVAQFKLQRVFLARQGLKLRAREPTGVSVAQCKQHGRLSAVAAGRACFWLWFTMRSSSISSATTASFFSTLSWLMRFISALMCASSSCSILLF